MLINSYCSNFNNNKNSQSTNFKGQVKIHSGTNEVFHEIATRAKTGLDTLVKGENIILNIHPLKGYVKFETNGDNAVSITLEALKKRFGTEIGWIKEPKDTVRLAYNSIRKYFNNTHNLEGIKRLDAKYAEFDKK